MYIPILQSEKLYIPCGFFPLISRAAHVYPVLIICSLFTAEIPVL